MHQWKEAGKTASDVLDVFPNLNAMEDALADQQVSGYLKRTALGVLSNITLRNFDPGFPRNRLLASLGALTKEVSWGPPSLSLSDLSEKVMSVCEEVNDYSFIYTSDERDDAPGLRWRPSATQQESIPARPVHLVPIISWGAWGEPFGETQRAYIDAQGLWLNCMIPLRTSDKTSDEATQMLNNWLHGFHGVEIETYEFLPGDGKEQLSVSSWMSKALRKMHFTGCPNPLICKNGYFFSQIEVHDHYDVQLFVAAGVRWVFGAPGIARWKEKGVFRYSAGVFAGQVNSLIVESVLME